MNNFQNPLLEGGGFFGEPHQRTSTGGRIFTPMTFFCIFANCI